MFFNLLVEHKKLINYVTHFIFSTFQVGNAFSNPGAKYELDTIASSPSGEHVFRVVSFDALEKIRQTLQSKIFSIEGIVVHLSLNQIWSYKMKQCLNVNCSKKYL